MLIPLFAAGNDDGAATKMREQLTPSPIASRAQRLVIK